MFEELDLKIADELSKPTESYFTAYSFCGCHHTNSGGYGTTCKYCC